jgi:hypothetical protein
MNRSFEDPDYSAAVAGKFVHMARSYILGAQCSGSSGTLAPATSACTGSAAP